VSKITSLHTFTLIIMITPMKWIRNAAVYSLGWAKDCQARWMKVESRRATARLLIESRDRLAVIGWRYVMLWWADCCRSRGQAAKRKLLNGLVYPMLDVHDFHTFLWTTCGLS
jgi:hypothetical protein